MPAPTVLFISRDNDPEAGQWLTALQAALPQTRLLSFEQADADARTTAQVAIVAVADTDKLSALPALRWVQSLWAGVESLLACPALANTPIVRMTDPGLSRTMAEAVLAWTLYLHRDMPAYRQAQTNAQWAPLPYRPAGDKTVGVLGCGELGRAALASLNQAGFQTRAWSRSARTLPGTQHFAGLQTLPDLLHACDILVNLLPATAATEKLLNRPRLACLPRGAALINFGRGSVLDDQALLAELDSGRLSHAVLDVFRDEPLPPDSPFWQHPSVTVLPHISAPTPVHSAAAAAAASNVRRFLQRGVIPTPVDRERGY
ncbi:glyoxylate/hydroxypyruvate reductase A [Granulosicoccaceae sp. 1_MG-2023]|nr:glyoxylate/hydroxypyruvate reductase A [Granulosicoccaceae sp. 1_MG-2023]